MKSIKIFATVGAIALLGMAGLSSCKQNNTPDEGNYNGEAIKTEFSISIPEAGNSNAGAPDRMNMPANSTQTDANPTAHFLGMNEMVLIPYETTGTDTVEASTAKKGDNIVLSDLGGVGKGNISSTGLSGTANYKVYWNVEIPLETNYFLFYAHGSGPVAQTSYSEAQNFEYGHLDVIGLGDKNTTAADIHFNLKKIYPTSGTEGDSIYQLLNDLVTVVDTVAGAPELKWADHTNTDIKALYDKYITNTAGSSNSVLAMLEDLYNSLEQYQVAYRQVNSGHSDSIVKPIMEKIAEKMTAASLASGTIGMRTLAWKANSKCAGYPLNIHLPDGAATVYWSGSAFVKSGLTSGTQANWMNITNLNNYVYPAALYYYANSALQVSNTPQVDKYPGKSWEQILALYTNGSAVASTTRSVAIKDPIQYGVASLKVTVKANGASLEDSKEKSITIANKYKLTAVLVGGQQNAKFDFSPNTGDAGTFVIYDSIMNINHYLSDDAPSSSQFNPTLVLETNKDKDINIAVEFLNEGEDFYGIDGKLIPKNTKFYVVGTLQSSLATETGLGNRVFVRDHMTVANLNLKSLKNAYNVVPDLTTKGLELGFSVDLSWQAGHVYTVNIE